MAEGHLHLVASGIEFVLEELSKNIARSVADYDLLDDAGADRRLEVLRYRGRGPRSDLGRKSSVNAAWSPPGCRSHDTSPSSTLPCIRAANPLIPEITVLPGSAV